MRDTLKYMRAFADQYKTNSMVRELALSLVRNLPQKDYAGEVKALWAYVKNSVRYVRDIHGVETVQTPQKTLEYGQGDCDDKSTLLAALLESLGHKTRFHAVGLTPGQLCHVLVEVSLGGKWIALETTEPVGLGWFPPGVVSHMIEGDGLGSLFSSAWSAVKNIGRKVDDTVVQKYVTTPLRPIVQNKAFQVVVSVAGAIPGPWSVVTVPLAAAVTIANKSIQINAAESAGRKIAAQKKAKDLNDAAAAKELAATRYVLDQATNQIREATQSDMNSGLQLLGFDPVSGQLVPMGAPAPDPAVANFLKKLREIADHYNAQGYTDAQAGEAFKAALASGVPVPSDPAEQMRVGYQLMDDYLRKNAVPLMPTSPQSLSKWFLPAIAAAVVGVVIWRNNYVR